MKKILICTPTYNESENIKNFCKQIYKIKNIDLLVIDDNSPDGTSEIIMKLKKKYNRLFLLKREKKMGIGSAIRAGMNYAIKNNYYAFLIYSPFIVIAVIVVVKLLFVCIIKRN